MEIKGQNIETGLRFYLTLAFLLLAVFLFNGQKVPFSNEYLYLLRLYPGFLPHDWTFGQPANEHAVFNVIFSIPAAFLSIEAIGWVGRALVWIGCMFLLILIGRLWQIGYAWVAAAIFIWLSYGQTIANGEWIFGGFEAKTFAYIFLLFAIFEFSRRNNTVSAVLLGFAFSLHPGVGLWAVPAVMTALAAERVPGKELLRAGALIFAGALPGILFLFADQVTGESGSYDNWRFMVIERFPWHLDPFYFTKREYLVMGLMLAFNTAVLWKSENFALRFLLKFQLFLALMFTSAIALRWFELYNLLRFQPMRLFPVFVGIFFLFTVFHVISTGQSRKLMAVAVMIAIVSIVLSDPVSYTRGRVDMLTSSWSADRSDITAAFIWVSQNTPDESLILAPPNYANAWYLGRRALVASFRYPPYDRLGEWRARVADLTGTSEFTGRGDGFSRSESSFNSLSQHEIIRLRERYGADYLISTGNYDFPRVFETETYVIYKLR